MAITAEELAAAFHESYERQAPEHNYKTRKASAVPWADVPEGNKLLMIAVAADLLERRVVVATDERFVATVIPRSAGNGKDPFQCRIVGHPNQMLVPDGIYERVGTNEDIA